MRVSQPALDPRRRKTRDALQSAFILLALHKAYDEIRIVDILAAAGIGRSTFYEYFPDKHALLAASMDGAVSILAGLPMGHASTRQVATLLAHFWQNKERFRDLFQGAGLRVIRSQLVTEIEMRLKRQAGTRLRLPYRLAARSLADGMLSPIVAWLRGEASCHPADLAQALVTSSVATHASLIAASDR